MSPIDFLITEALGGLGICSTGYNPVDRKVDAVVSALSARHNREALVAWLIEDGIISEAGTMDGTTDQIRQSEAQCAILWERYETARDEWKARGAYLSGVEFNRAAEAKAKAEAAGREYERLLERQGDAVPLYRVNRGEA